MKNLKDLGLLTENTDVCIFMFFCKYLIISELSAMYFYMNYKLHYRLIFVFLKVVL